MTSCGLSSADLLAPGDIWNHSPNCDHSTCSMIRRYSDGGKDPKLFSSGIDLCDFLDVLRAPEYARTDA